MSEQRPVGLSVYRPVILGDPDWHTILTERLERENHLQPEEISEILKPALAPKAVLVSPAEIARLSKALDSTIELQQARGLADYLQENMPQSAREPGHLPLLPVVVKGRAGKSQYKELKVGRTAKLEERQGFKRVLANYFNLPWVPTAAGVWTPESQASGIRIALGKDKSQRTLIEGLRLLIRREGLLPEQIELEPAKVDLAV